MARRNPYPSSWHNYQGDETAFMTGGCVDYADVALRILTEEAGLDGELIGLFLPLDGRPEHVLVRVGDLYVDAFGWHTADEVRAFWGGMKGIDPAAIELRPIGWDLLAGYDTDENTLQDAEEHFRAHVLGAVEQASSENPGEPPSLKQALLALRPQLAAAAQVVYDEWAQDEEGIDEMLGAGGICQDIADAMGNVVAAQLDNVDIHTLDAQCGEQHVWIAVVAGDEAYHVDIPPSTYETGGGYNWRKRADVTIGPGDVMIWAASLGDFVEGYEENPVALPRLPVLAFKQVFHVGAEPAAVLPKRSAMSYEGPGLSVSVHPEAWRKIARLGDAPVWRLRRADGAKGQFVNMKKLLRDEALVAALLDETRSRGLVEGAGAYRLTYRDGETGQRAYMDFATEAAAQENREDFGGTVKLVASFRALPALQRWWREFFTKDVPDSFAREAAIIAVLHGSGLDGLWWPDRFNVLHLSAPRGVIFPAALSLWTLS